MPPTRFNIRVYGLWIHEEKLLVNEERIKGLKVTKFPGGGLELGEGTLDGLKREWKEELNLDIEILSHFYTTDFFQPSAFDDSQVISIYYRVSSDPEKEISNRIPGEYTQWKNLGELNEETFTLPIDKQVGRLLLKDFRKGKL